MKRYVVSKSAKQDIDDIWLYLATRSGSFEPAERLIWRLHDTILNLSANPGIGRRCDEIDQGGRCFPTGDYIVYYREQAGRIVITHVFHGRRDQKRAWRA